jgi:hypothetical protein
LEGVRVAANSMVTTVRGRQSMTKDVAVARATMRRS